MASNCRAIAGLSVRCKSCVQELICRLINCAPCKEVDGGQTANKSTTKDGPDVPAAPRSFPLRAGRGSHLQSAFTPCARVCLRSLGQKHQRAMHAHCTASGSPTSDDPCMLLGHVRAAPRDAFAAPPLQRCNIVHNSNICFAPPPRVGQVVCATHLRILYYAIGF